MKPLTGIITAACLFGLSTALAWFTNNTSSGVEAGGQRQRVMPNKSATTASLLKKEAQAAVSQYERDLLYGSESTVERLSAAGLEEIIRQCGRGNGSFPGADDAILRYFLNWGDQDPPAACAWLDRRGISHPIVGDISNLMWISLFFGTWAEKDPEAALAAAASLRFPGRRAQALLTTLTKLAGSDPDRARALFVKHLEIFDSEQTFFDPPDFGDGDTSAFDFLASLPAGKARGKLLAGMLGTTTTSPATRTALWEKASDDVKRDLVAAGFADRYALETLEKPVEGVSQVFAGMEDLARGHAETSGDIREAKNFVEQHGRAWAARDLGAALEWAQAHLKGQERLELSAGLFQAGAAADFEGTIARWQSLPDGSLKVHAAAALVKGTPEDRRAEALAVVDTLSPHDRAAVEKVMAK